MSAPPNPSPVSEQGARALLPNRLTVATEDYILSRRLYLYTSATPKPLARKFVDFALGKAGQDVVAANGFVEQNVRVEESSEPVPGASAQYQQATRGAQRLSLDFRFRTGSSQLDNKALADIDRVTGLLADLHYTGKNSAPAGFRRQHRNRRQKPSSLQRPRTSRSLPIFPSTARIRA